MSEPDELLRHAAFLRSVVRELLRDEHEVDDVLQSTYIAALSRRETPRAWLRAVARNFARMVSRAGSRRTKHERGAARPEAVPANTVERIEVQQQLLDSVRELEEPYRQVILLRFYDGLAPREIARKLDVPTATVHTRIKRALAMLRGRLDHIHGGARGAWCVALLPLVVAPSRLIPGVLAMKKVAGIAAVVCVATTLFLVWRARNDEESAIERTEVAQGRVVEKPPPVETNGKAPEPPTTERTAEGVEAPGPDRLAGVSGNPSTAALRVLVVDERDVPCADAKVSLARYARAKRVERVEDETGADGVVEIRDFTPGKPQLSVRLGALQRITEVVLVAGRVTEATIVMPSAGTRVEGVVRRREEGPLADASVTFSARGTYVHARADDRGHYRADALPRGTYRIEVHGLGWAGELVVAGEEHLRRDIEVGIASLSGVVRDAVTRQPIPGVQVRVQKPASRECMTDAEGAYRFEDVPNGKGRLVLVKEGYELKFVDAGVFVAGTSRTLDVALHAATELDLHVTDEEGRPVEGPLRLIIDDGSGTTVSTGVMADAAGHAIYRKIRPGAYELSVRRGSSRSHLQEFTVHAGTNTIHFRFQSGPDEPMLRGKVLDATTNRPAPGVSVHAMSMQKTVVTDHRGEFRFQRLPSAEEVLYVSKDGYGFQKVHTEKLDKGVTRSVSIELHPGATLALTITEPDGEPPRQKSVMLLFKPADTEWREKWSAHVDVDEGGRAVYRCMPPGKYRLIVITKIRSASVEIDVPPAGTSVDVRLR